MPKVTYIEPSGNEVVIDVPVGWSLMQAATSNGVEGIEAECGGSCACATCHCYIESHADQVPAAEQGERDMLHNAVAEIRANSRLSCQIKISDQLAGLVVRLPESQI
ncbi:MAG: 2Fe-2S iron-sulfur cluster-binding protein [Burkholderiaceae bacterium]